MDAVKAGWVYKRSSVLHRWKKRWLVLDRNGVLHVFKSPNTPRASDFFVLRACCLVIKDGSRDDVTPPSEVEGSSDCIMQLNMRDGHHLTLCAQSVDDAKTWLLVLEDARATGAPPPGPSPVAPSAPFGGQVINNQQYLAPAASGPIVYQQVACPAVGTGFVAGFGRVPGRTMFPDPYTGSISSGDYCGRVVSAAPVGQPITGPVHTQVMRNRDGSKTTVINPDGRTLYVDNSMPQNRHQYRRYMYETGGMPQVFQPM